MGVDGVPAKVEALWRSAERAGRTGKDQNESSVGERSRMSACQCAFELRKEQKEGQGKAEAWLNLSTSVESRGGYMSIRSLACGTQGETVKWSSSGDQEVPYSSTVPAE